MSEQTDPKSVLNNAPADYTLDQVASIAATLLKGDLHTHCTDATKGALKLLDACRFELAERARKRAIFEAADAENRAKDALVPRDANGKAYPMPWLKAIAHVTGQSREIRAQPLFKKFYAYWWQIGKATSANVPFDQVAPPTDSEIDNRIAEFKRDGIGSRTVAGWHEQYKVWRQKYDSDRARSRAEARHGDDEKNPSVAKI